VVNFDQTHPSPSTQINLRWGGKIVANQNNEKHKEYARYATHCLDMVTITKDRDARAIQREMARVDEAGRCR